MVASTHCYDEEGFPVVDPEPEQPFLPPNPRPRLRKRAVVEARKPAQAAATPRTKFPKLSPSSSKKQPEARAPEAPKPRAKGNAKVGRPKPSPEKQQGVGRNGRGLPSDLPLCRPSVCVTKEDNPRVQLVAFTMYGGKSVKQHISTLNRKSYGPKFVEHTEALAAFIRKGGVTKEMALQERAELEASISA